MTNTVLENRDITLLTKVHVVIPTDFSGSHVDVRVGT